MSDAVYRNVRAHDRAARVYELRHGEIFNPLEQARLRAVVAEAVAAVRTGARPILALDFGCGTGNLTAHLLAAGAQVVAADVSERSLAVVRRRFEGGGRVRTLRLDQSGLSAVAAGSVDLACAYSVLHHVPDHLAAVRDLVRVLRAGGVVYIDHEASPSYWLGDERYAEWRRSRTWRYGLDLIRSTTWNWALYRLRRLRDPRATEEGDLHVWRDDHVEWSSIHRILEEAGCVVLREEDHLVYRRHHDVGAYERYRAMCSDTRMLLARKER
jgi:SAM-dependent methyltransferase